jgi:hypothetical protein
MDVIHDFNAFFDLKWSKMDVIIQRDIVRNNYIFFINKNEKKRKRL